MKKLIQVDEDQRKELENIVKDRLERMLGIQEKLTSLEPMFLVTNVTLINMIKGMFGLKLEIDVKLNRIEQQ